MKPGLIFLSAPLPKGADRKMRGSGGGGGSAGPLNIFIDPTILDRTSVSYIANRNVFFCVFSEKSIISRFPFQLYTKLNNLKFEIPKNFWRGAHSHRAPSPGPSPALSRASPSIRASPSNIGHFALSIQASPDSAPPTFETWLRLCLSLYPHPWITLRAPQYSPLRVPSLPFPSHPAHLTSSPSLHPKHQIVWRAL